MKLLFHMNIKAHSEWHCANFGRGKYSKNMSLFDFQELQLKNGLFIKRRTENGTENGMRKCRKRGECSLEFRGIS